MSRLGVGCVVGRRLRLGNSILRIEVATQNDFAAHHVEEVCGRNGDADLFGCSVFLGDSGAASEDAGHVREIRLCAVAQVDVVRIGEGQIVDVALAQVHAGDDQLAGIAIRERLEQDRIGDAEDGGAGADAERDGKNGGQCVARTPGENARSDSDIFPCHGATSEMRVETGN